jgi:fumarate reductase subunit D
MMRFQQTIILSLSIVLMFMLGSMPLSLASHSIDHHHHSAQTHTTGICAWMCTAAQTISTDSQILSANFSLLEIIPTSGFSPVGVPPKIFFPARAPPY